MATIDTLPPTQQIEHKLVHDARAVRDTAHLFFPKFIEGGEPDWVLATVTPDPTSGSATVPGAHINAETGEFVAPENATTVVIKKGSWQKASSANPDHPDSEKFSWSEPMEQEKRSLTPEDYYSPFAFGGTIIFKHTPDKLDIEQFEPVHLLFPEWAKHIEGAAKISDQHKDLFEKDRAEAGDEEQLKTFLSNANPLVKIWAFRGLIEAEKMTTKITEVQLRSDDIRLTAILTFLLLVNSESEAENPFIPAIVDSLQTAQNVERIRPFVLGSFSAALFQNQKPTTTSSKQVLEAACLQLKKLEIPEAKQMDMPLVFTKMSVGQD